MMGFLDRLNQGFANAGRPDLVGSQQGFLSGLMNAAGQQPMNLTPPTPVGQPRAPRQGGGFLDNLHNAVSDNRGMMLGLGTGLLSNGWAGAANAMGGMQYDEQRRAQEAEQERLQRQQEAQMQLGQQFGVDPLFFDAGLGEQALSSAMRPAERTTLERNAIAAGFTPETPEYRQFIQDNMVGDNSNLPPGFRQLPDGSAAPIPGTPQHQEWIASQEQQSEQSGARQTAGNVVFNAANDALLASRDRQLEGYAGAVAGAVDPHSANAEIYRQTNVLRDLAAAESLNAMRRQSPTGGALGNVTERELALLSRQAGALDPASPNFERDLERYTLALYQIIHGYEAGSALFEQELGAAFAQSPPSNLPPEAASEWNDMTPQERGLFLQNGGA